MLRDTIRLMELYFRIYLRGFYHRMADYHARQSDTYFFDDTTCDRWMRHGKLSYKYNKKFFEEQNRINNLKDYLKETIERLT